MPGSFAHGILQARILEWVCHAFLQGIILTQGSKVCLSMSPALGGRFFTTSATWKVWMKVNFSKKKKKKKVNI